MQLHRHSTEAEGAATTVTGMMIVTIAIVMIAVIATMMIVMMTGEDVMVITKK